MGRKFDKNARKGPSPQQKLLEDNDSSSAETEEAHLTGGGVQIIPEEDSTDEYFPISDEEQKHLSIWAQQREELREELLVEAAPAVWKVWTDQELQQKVRQEEDTSAALVLPPCRPVWRDEWQPEATSAASPDELQPPLLSLWSDSQRQKLRQVARTRPRRLWTDQGWQQASAEISAISRSRSSIAVVLPRRPLWGNEWHAEEVTITAASITSSIPSPTLPGENDEKYQDENQEQEDDEEDKEVAAALLTLPTDISQSPQTQPTATSRVAGLKQKKKKRLRELKRTASYDKENEQQKNEKKSKQQESSEQLRRISSRATKGVPANRYGEWIK